MAFKPSLKRKFVPTSMEINITPIMNLVVVLIPLLLATAEWVKLGLIESKMPPAGGGGGELTEQVEKKALNLIVSIEDEQIAISLFGATLENPLINEVECYHTIPLQASGEYDFAALNMLLYDIREDVVEPGILQEQIPSLDRFGNPVYNPDGTPLMVNDYIYNDVDNVRISAPNSLPFQSLVSVLDACRVYRDDAGHVNYLFPVPFLGKLS